MASGDIIVKMSDGTSEFTQLTGDLSIGGLETTPGQAVLSFNELDSVNVEFPQDPDYGTTQMQVAQLVVMNEGGTNLVFTISQGTGGTLPALLDPTKTYDLAIIEH